MTQTIGAVSWRSPFLWSLVVAALALLAVAALVWRIRRRRSRPVPPDPLGLPSLAGGPFALPAGPSYEADAPAEPALVDAAEPAGTLAWSRWPFAPATTAGERERSEAIARIMVQALREIGPAPSCSATTRLAEQLALIIVSDLREDHDLGLSEGVALTASISDELSCELHQLVGASQCSSPRLCNLQPHVGGRGKDSISAPLRAREA